jgi:hypothetical protein
MTLNRFSLTIVLLTVAVFAALALSTLTPTHGPAVDASYDQIELVRAQNYRAAATQQAYQEQRRYDEIELLRAESYQAAAARQAYLDQRRGEWIGGK